MTALRAPLMLSCLLAASALLPAGSDARERSRPEKVPVFDGLKVVTVARDLEHPWGLAFLPDAGMLVTERPGRLRHITREGRVSPPLAGLPAIAAGGQGGLLDVVTDPDFASNRRVYVSYTEAEGRVNGLAVARGTLSADARRLESVQVIFQQQPKVDSSGHFGGRLVFARDGTLFVTLGDRQRASERDKVQSLAHHHGKVVRIHADGRVPADNPFVTTAGALPEIWSLGHRNPQGAALHPVTGELWISEHGPQGGDEINLVRAGGNYGWPVVSHGCEYVSCRAIGDSPRAPGMTDPVTYWIPTSIAPSGLAFYTGNRYPGWQGNLFSGALAGQALWRLQLDGDRVIGRQALLSGYGERIRDVRQGPDGWLYLLTDSGAGRLLRLER